MAFSFDAFKLSFLRRDTTPGAAAPVLPRGLPLIGRLPVARQLQVLTGLLVVVLLADAAIVVMDARQATFNTLYVAAVGKIRMLSQRLAKAAQQASQGNPAAFKQLRESRDEFARLVTLLIEGGAAGGVELPPTPERVRPVLDALETEWRKTERNAEPVIREERNLVALGAAVRTINSSNPALLELADEIAGLSVQSGGSIRQNALTAELVMLTQRMAKNANAMLAGDIVDPEVAFLLGKDTNTFKDALQGLIEGNALLRIARVGDAEIRGKLAELDTAFQSYQAGASVILGNMQKLVNAKRATRDLFNDSETLLGAAERLSTGYEEQLAARRANFVAMVVVSLLAVVFLLMIGKVYLDDTQRGADDAQLRAEDTRRRAEQSERQNRANQDAILRLLDEIDNLANGDLTVRAKVTEDMTGAIADAINNTIDEMRRLVVGINDAAQQVTAATAEAQAVTGQLLQATERQASEIEQTGLSATQMAQSMNEVSLNANDTAKVAETSLAAAGKGAHAVQNAIRGMNEIRDQMQETSKRIKRLGESSQEIGEIVQLISDITEQTNVLALNAAIQAASAGEAGRGFTVVAEEVQRLAERSAEATKHIAAIVNSIQRDTQDAVEAMERSTRGVVEGTQTADEADRALREIEQISTRLAALITSISSATQQQVLAATQVAGNMKLILGVTQLTSAGTKRTALSAARLTELAVALKKSVAGFRLT